MRSAGTRRRAIAISNISALSRSQLARQNLVVFAGGLVAGVGSFVFHAVAARMLGPVAYGRVAFLIAIYAVGATVALVITMVLARQTAAALRSRQSTTPTALLAAMKLVVGPSVAIVLLIGVIAEPLSRFGHQTSTTPVLILGFAIAFGWLLAIPRGILQGLQRFAALALNLALEPIVRTLTLLLVLIAGYAVAGAITAVAAGLIFGLVIGLIALRDRFADHTQLRMSDFLGFSLTAAAGIIGIQVLFNQDVALAEHYLSGHDGGIYGGLNKIATIVYYLTLSVSQVQFPRVVQAVTQRQHPGRTLGLSAMILGGLGAGSLVVFAVVPGLLVQVLYGPSFRDAAAYVPAMGIIGLALSLDNLLVQFCIAIHDRGFIVILAAACVCESALIAVFHTGVEQVVVDVLSVLVGLLVLLTIWSYLAAGRHARSLMPAETASFGPC